MADDRLRGAFKRAAEIASVVPESMHQAAFNRALDAVLGVRQVETGEAGKASKGPRAEPRSPEKGPSDPVAALSAMERQKAPEVDSAQGGIAKGLALLRVARRELEIDGLTASQIATVLTNKFRWRVTRQAVAEAMDRAGNRVDRQKDGRTTRYRIMETGEQWLDLPADKRPGEDASGGGGQSVTRRRRKSTRPSKAAPTSVKSTAAPAPRKAPARRPGRGPKAAVETLINAGWFASPRALGAIRTELENRLALRFKTTDLSPAMTRLLRDGKLKRSKTESGQYEYRA